MESWSLRGSPRRLSVSVLTGILGSGKMAVLNYPIQQPALSRTLVLISEFGEVGLDHDLVTHSKDGVVIEMSSGCLWCTIRDDLAKTLRKEWPSKDRRSRTVFITRDIDESVIRDTLRMFTDAEAQRPERLPVELGDSDIAVFEVRR